MNYAIRRHLGTTKVMHEGKKQSVKGFFQIRECEGNTKLGKVIGYIDGTKNTIEMSDCYLHNALSRSQHIYNGRDKGVHKERCAWIVCADYSITELKVKTDVQICFNPRISPNWTFEKMNINNTKFENLFTNFYKIYQK